MEKNKYIIKPGSTVLYEGSTYRTVAGRLRGDYKDQIYLAAVGVRENYLPVLDDHTWIYLDDCSYGATKPTVVALDMIVRVPEEILDINLWGHSIHLRMIEGQVRVSWDRETMTRRFDVITAFGKPMFSVLDPYDPNRNVWVDG